MVESKWKQILCDLLDQGSPKYGLRLRLETFEGHNKIKQNGKRETLIKI